jgi:hypothetical protein
MRHRLVSADRLIVLIIVIAAAFSLAGCDLMTAVPTTRPSRVASTPVPPPEPDPTEIAEVPTLRPEPSGDRPDLLEAANALADLDSYRVAVESRGLVPATTADGTVRMTSTLIQGRDPAAAFTMTGVDGLAGGRLEAIVIGDEAWLREGSGRWLRSPGGAADFDAAFTTLSPIDLVSGFEGLADAVHRTGAERRNGLRTIRYHTEAGDDEAVAAGLVGGEADLWLAADGGYLVALAIDGRWDLDGTATPIHLGIEVTRVNDPANKVTPPG